MSYDKYSKEDVRAVFDHLGGEAVVDGIIARTMTATIHRNCDIAVARKMLVDYDQALSELFKHGKYTPASEYLTDEGFPSTGMGKKEVEFIPFNFNDSMDLATVIEAMKKDGCRPATTKENLTYGVKFHGRHDQAMIALGTVVKIYSHPNVTFIDWNSMGQHVVDLTLADAKFTYNCQYLGVRLVT